MTLNINFSSVTIAVNKMAEMVYFYDNMFNTNMLPFEDYGTIFYEGNLAGLKIVFCPSEVSGIVSEKNKHQFNFVTNNIAEVLSLASESGGKQKGEIVPAINKIIVAVTDPDGNTLEFMQSVEVVSTPEPVVIRKKNEPIITKISNKPAAINENKPAEISNDDIPEVVSRGNKHVRSL
jgi:predicted enzyme related to lactoylglutathione lyase